MILQSLYQLAKAENLVGDPDFEIKPVVWVVELGRDGGLIQISDLRRNLNEGQTNRQGKPLKPRYVGKNEEIPIQPGRTSGDFAFAFTDKPEYSIGIDPAGKRDASKVAARAELFRKIIEDCAHATDEGDVRVVADFLAAKPFLSDDMLAKVPPDLGLGDLVAFRVGGEDEPLVHQLPAVRSWWKQQRQSDAVDDAARFHCLVTGEPIASPGLVPQIKLVPGGVALVSFNTSAYESYGLDGNENAPISDYAALSISTAINRLLSKRPINAAGEDLPVWRFRLSADTIVVYWSPEAPSEELDAISRLLEADPNEVGEMYRGVWGGAPPKIKNPSRFNAMILTGIKGRAIVRGYLDTTTSSVFASLSVYFTQISIIRNASPLKGQEYPPSMPITAMLDALAAPGREASVFASLATELFWAAVDQRRDFPRSILQRALLRERAEAGAEGWVAAARRDARAAIIKAVLIRSFTFPLENSMNPMTDHAGYQLGMLTAVLERLQAIAIDNPNASLVDCYFASASASPSAVFPRLLKLARHHVRKAKGSDSRPDQAMAYRYERIIDSISTRFEYDPDARKYPQSSAFPMHLSLSEQGLFVLGYHQMRHWLWMNDAERTQWESDHAEAPRAYLWKNAERTQTLTA